MDELLGEFSCKIDNKGRLMFPAGLKKLLPTVKEYRFVINRGFEKCLVLYPIDTWKKVVKEISHLNRYVKHNREFIRYFYRGATEISLDSTNRMLIPRSLMKYAGIQKNVVVFAYLDCIEIWDEDTYENLLSDEPEGFADLAELTMGNKENKPQENVS